jgi:hypothetical protein
VENKIPEQMTSMQIQDLSTFSYCHAVICGLGFESRSIYVAQSISARAKKRFAIGYTNEKRLSYKRNHRAFGKMGFDIAEADDFDFSFKIGSVLDQIWDTKIAGTKFRIAIDISVFNRRRIALIVEALLKSNRHIEIHFFYALSNFVEPAPEFSPTAQVDLISEYFSGWSRRPGQKVLALVGLGYERELALGCLDYIQASQYVLFVPSGPIPEYDYAIRTQNESLFEVTKETSIITYDIMSPLGLVEDISSLVATLTLNNSVAIIPFGPKLFTLASLLVIRDSKLASILRMSTMDYSDVRDRLAAGYVTGYTVSILPSLESPLTGDEVLTELESFRFPQAALV